MWRCGPENETRELDWREPTEAKKLVGKETYKSCRSKLSVGLLGLLPRCVRETVQQKWHDARAQLDPVRVLSCMLHLAIALL